MFSAFADPDPRDPFSDGLLPPGATELDFYVIAADSDLNDRVVQGEAVVFEESLTDHEDSEAPASAHRLGGLPPGVPRERRVFLERNGSRDRPLSFSAEPLRENTMPPDRAMLPWSRTDPSVDRGGGGELVRAVQPMLRRGRDTTGELHLLLLPAAAGQARAPGARRAAATRLLGRSARARVEQLVAAGMKKSEVARRAGNASPAVISKILKPGSSINAETAERILSVSVSPAAGTGSDGTSARSTARNYLAATRARSYPIPSRSA